jgi:2-oxoacid:acceptor oxidoreductase gamma subunit (pyruvate/2-ketoisovalerate family)/2-oxoacid:acceptor oxidoreductase delta subunit (pyruvate/2-ketoisovalerate family)
MNATSMGEIRIHGRGGQGTVVAAEILSTAFVLEGKYAANFPFFGQERRGAPVSAFVRFGLEPIRQRSRVYRPDIVLILDPAMAANPECYAGLRDGGMVILNTKRETIVPSSVKNLSCVATVDATGISLEEIGLPIPNSCMLGAFASATQLVQLDTVTCALQEFLKGNILVKNTRALQRGFEAVKVQVFKRGKESIPEPASKAPDRSVSRTIPFQSRYESGWADASKLLTVRTGEWRFMAPLLDRKTCRQCGWCSIYCPLGCMKLQKDGYFLPDLNYCKGCGICAYECPAHAIRMAMEEVKAH